MRAIVSSNLKSHDQYQDILTSVVIMHGQKNIVGVLQITENIDNDEEYRDEMLSELADDSYDKDTIDVQFNDLANPDDVLEAVVNFLDKHINEEMMTYTYGLSDYAFNTIESKSTALNDMIYPIDFKKQLRLHDPENFDLKLMLDNNMLETSVVLEDHQILTCVYVGELSYIV